MGQAVVSGAVNSLSQVLLASLIPGAGAASLALPQQFMHRILKVGTAP